jgi:CRP-like cAMP-binding protein
MLASRIELLERLPFFRGLSGEQLDLIAGVSKKAFFEAGENLITKDEPGEAAYVIMTGIARCLDLPGAPASEAQIGPGVLVGELAMLADTVHAFTVQAEERVRAIALRREALKYVMELDPAIAQQIAGNLLTRLQAFGRELRKADDFLAQVNTAAEEPRIARPRSFWASILPDVWPASERETRRSGS